MPGSAHDSSVPRKQMTQSSGSRCCSEGVVLKRMGLGGSCFGLGLLFKLLYVRNHAADSKWLDYVPGRIYAGVLSSQGLGVAGQSSIPSFWLLPYFQFCIASYLRTRTLLAACSEEAHRKLHSLLSQSLQGAF